MGSVLHKMEGPVHKSVPPYVGMVTAGVWRARAWTRGSILVYHFLQLAIGVGSLQGFVPRPDIASWIIIPSVVGIVLALTPPITEYLSRRD